MDQSMNTDLILAALLPPDLVDFIRAHILHPNSPFQYYKRQAMTQAQRFIEALFPIFEPLFNRLLLLAAENQGLVGIAVSIAAVTAALVVMNWVRRLLMWWTRFVARLAFWAAVVAVAAFVWERGLARSARDVVVLGSKVVGYGAVVKDIWLREYDQYEAQRVGAAGGGGGRASSHR